LKQKKNVFVGGFVLFLFFFANNPTSLSLKSSQPFPLLFLHSQAKVRYFFSFLPTQAANGKVYFRKKEGPLDWKGKSLSFSGL
jgi:hypothetical protein